MADKDARRGEETGDIRARPVLEYGNGQRRASLDYPTGFSPRPIHHLHTRHHHQRIDLLRRGQGQLQNFPFFSFENLSPWLTVSNNSFCQQKLKEWQPNFSYASMGKLCLFLSSVMVPLGALLLLIGITTEDFKINYGEDCYSAGNYLRLFKKACVFCSEGNSPICSEDVSFPTDWKTPVYVYYELDNFHQNYRQLVKSVDPVQLRGKIFSDPDSPYPVPIAPAANCYPYINDSSGSYYFPCGAMANAMFGDSFVLRTKEGNEITLRKHGIAYPLFKKYKFKNPPHITPNNYNYKRIFTDNFVKPKGNNNLDWSMELWNEWWKNGGSANEGFINWMIPSAKPKLRKLHAIIDSVPDCPLGLFCKGNYTAEIEYRFDVESFNGKKAFIFSTISMIGSRNLFISLLSLIQGAFLASIGFYVLHISESNLRRRVNRSSHSETSVEIIKRKRSKQQDQGRESARYHRAIMPPLLPFSQPMTNLHSINKSNEVRASIPVQESRDGQAILKMTKNQESKIKDNGRGSEPLTRSSSSDDMFTPQSSLSLSSVSLSEDEDEVKSI